MTILRAVDLVAFYLSRQRVRSGDRIKDMIISGGLKVFPTEVEEFLYTHQTVEECAVIGMSHSEYSEAVAAFVKKGISL
jgi:acyl-CoA synthetase (AMP-forming)/AMP-acid ligase II